MLDEERSGRPQEISNDNELSSIIRSDRQITVKQHSSRLNASVGTVHEWHKALFEARPSVFVRWNDVEKPASKNRVEKPATKRTWKFLTNTVEFLSNIITENKTTLTLYMPESRRESLNGSCLEGSQQRRDSIPEEPSQPCSSHRRVMILSVWGIDIGSSWLMNGPDRSIESRRKLLHSYSAITTEYGLWKWVHCQLRFLEASHFFLHHALTLAHLWTPLSSTSLSCKMACFHRKQFSVLR